PARGGGAPGGVCGGGGRPERGEPVVVAEADLVRGDRVVLVHHRYDTECQKSFEGALGVAVVPTALQVVGREQHLADGEPVPGERRRVPLGQQQLPDAGRRLLGGEV